MSEFPPLPQGHEQYPWVASFLGMSPYARASGMAVTAVGPGTVQLTLPARPEWSGSLERNLVHTGCLCVLADTASGLSVGTLLDQLVPFVTLDLRMDYLRSADASRGLICQAHCHRLSPNVAFTRAELTQPGSDEVIACTNATFMRAVAPTGRRASGGAPAPALHPIPAEVLAAAVHATQPAVPKGRSPYVDFLGVMQHTVPGVGPVFRLPYREDLIGNPAHPAIHGGVLAGFAETAMILHMAAITRINQGGIPKAVDFSIDYLRAAKPVDTYVQAIPVRQGNRVSLLQAIIWQEDPQRPVAVARGHCLMPQA